MALSGTGQGERKNCFYIKPPLPLQSSMFIEISLGGRYRY